MYKSVIISTTFHFAIIIVTMISLPFVAKKPIDIPPLVSIELIQITDNTNIPYAPKAKKIIEKVKKKKKNLYQNKLHQKK